VERLRKTGYRFFIAMESTQGKLLLASPRLADPNFAQSVVLMIQHNEQGALGLVLNRPLTISVRQACESTLDAPCEVDAFLHHGGPCEGPLMVLHGNELAKDADVLPGVFFTTEKSKIESLLKHQTPLARYFVGYSGWSAGQLEAEMELESWVVVQAAPDHVFQDVANLWVSLMRRELLGQWIDPARIPDDPTVN
jgi:putative transcriptional regulator